MAGFLPLIRAREAESLCVALGAYRTEAEGYSIGKNVIFYLQEFK